MPNDYAGCGQKRGMERHSFKTALSAEAWTRFLPYIALGSGVNGRDWGADWIQCRMVEGLEFGDYALPSFSERTCRWTESP